MSRLVRWIRKILVFLIGETVVLIFICLATWQVFVVGVIAGPTACLVSCLIGLLAAITTIIVHELGHWVAARLVGLEPEQVHLFIVKLAREATGWRVRWNTWFEPAGLVGLNIRTSPRQTVARFVIVSASGVLANLLVGGLCILLAASFNRPETEAWAWLESRFHGAPLGAPLSQATAAWNLAALAQFASALLNLFPVQVHGYLSDGAVLLALWANRRELRVRFLPYQEIWASIIQGTRPRDLDRGVLERLLDMQDGSAMDAPICLLGFYHALDSGEPAQARRYLDVALASAQCLLVQKPVVAAEAAYYEARYCRNAVRARELLDQTERDRIPVELWLRAESAVLLAEGKLDLAATQATLGLEALRNSTDLGGSKTERDWLEDLLAQCQLSAPPSPAN